MKRWAFLTVGLYLLCASALAGLLSLAAHKGDAIAVLGYFHMFMLPVLLLVQAALLIVPVAIAQERPVKRRSVAVSAAMAAIPMVGLAILAVFSAELMFNWNSGPTSPEKERWLRWLAFSALVAFWLFWGIVFYRNLARCAVRPVTRWLLRGSILELLVAVPSHIVTRARGDCCAPFVTMLGIAAGLSVALLAFGPGLFFLFAKKFKDKQGKRHDPPVL